MTSTTIRNHGSTLSLALTALAASLFAGGLSLGLVLWLYDGPGATATATAEPVAAAPAALSGIHYDPPRTVSHLRGVDHNAKPFFLSRQPHPLSMVVFGYVSCTDVCPTNLKRMEKMLKLLGPDADQVQFVFVSIDPANEPPEVMKEYLSYYEGEIVGLTSEEPDGLVDAYRQWGIVRNRVELDKPMNGRNYKFDHTGQIFLIQGGEKLVVSYPYGTSAKVMADDVRGLLADPTLADARLPQVGAIKKVSIPPNSFTRRAQDRPGLPAYLRLNVGDTIKWRNDDYMYHFVGDISLAPGDEATQTFSEAGEFYFGCTALPSEVIRINVVGKGEAG